MGGVRSPLKERLGSELASWMVERRGFADVLSANRDKVRKKLRSAADDAALLDVRAELLVLALLSSDRRFDVAFEAYGSGRGGPDLTVVFRLNLRFDIEVTRPRASATRALAGKLRQLRAGAPNVVVLVGGVDMPAAAAARGDRNYTRLSAVATVSDSGCELWLAPDARHPLPRELALALARCLGARAS